MKSPIFTIKIRNNFIKITAAYFLIFIACSYSFAQYKGAPVKKDRLIQAIRSRQLQTRDIVTIINSNGVDFQLTAETKKALIAAGARPEVIKAVAGNPRFEPKNNVVAKTSNKNANRRSKPATSKPAAIKPAAPNYDDLLDKAIYSYQDRKNPNGTIRILENAARVKPNSPEAYQMLGYVYLYGLNNFAQAEASMRKSVTKGGSAVFRVRHDDDGDFRHHCTGSLFVSQDTLRFESDDNKHTFETAAVNVDKIKLDKISTRAWKNYSVFKIFFKIGNDKANFRFAPLTGDQQESKMVERFITSPNLIKNTAVFTNTSIQ